MYSEAKWVKIAIQCPKLSKVSQGDLPVVIACSHSPEEKSSVPNVTRSESLDGRGHAVMAWKIFL